MTKCEFIPEHFKMKKLTQKINLFELIKNLKVPLTFNQLMKFDGEIDTIFIFDENSIEIPCLLSYCHYFNIKVYIPSSDDIAEVKTAIKFSEIICIPTNYKTVIEEFTKKQEIYDTLHTVSLKE